MSNKLNTLLLLQPILITTILFSASCGTKSDTNLAGVSDSAQDSSSDALDGRGTDTDATDTKDEPKTDPKPDATPPVKVPNTPQFGGSDGAVNFDPSDSEEGCGDGERDVESEECDDGNRASGDGCSANCASEATIVEGAREVLEVGYAHVCYIDPTTIQLKCWGWNDFGQLGQGNTTEISDGVGTVLADADPVDIGTGISPELVVAGGDVNGNHTCIISNKNEVKCWGDNASGQLGQGSTSDLGDGANEMGEDLAVIDLGTDLVAQDIDVGARHSCALLDTGDIKCWGRNTSGELGLGDTSSRGDAANEMGTNLTAVPLGRDATAIALGGAHTCALLDNATVKCWGANASGQLGQGNTTTLGDGAGEVAGLSAISLGTGRTALQITAGNAHSCALLDNHTVKCWGANASGQLGQGSTDNLGDGANEMGDNLTAISLGTGRTATAIVAGDDYTCALLDNATVKCWGDNTSGQLGQGSTANLGDGANEMGDNLTAISLGTGRTAVSIGAGGFTSCAVLDNDTVKCWGENAHGQLGQESTADKGDGANEMGNNLTAIDTGF
jgi:cysteine-rich repeat protein